MLASRQKQPSQTLLHLCLLPAERFSNHLDSYLAPSEQQVEQSIMNHFVTRLLSAKIADELLAHLFKQTAEHE